MVTPVISSIDFSDFISGLVTGYQGRTPLFGTLETTFRCNLNCIHCYVNEPAHDARAQARELSIGRLLRLMDEIADQGCLNLLLTGGEVLIRPFQGNAPP
ncbi:MAG: radical SAM protein [Deltaproteobacteria bacterium]|nr:radical SAM protein [Deltaproteobacteria bacterium]